MMNVAAERSAIVAEGRRQIGAPLLPGGALLTRLTGPGAGRPRFRRLRAMRLTEAMDRLTTPYAAEEPAERRRAAVALLVNAFHRDGPTLTTLLDVDDARRRLGSALAYVEAVEQVLRQELDIYPVFSR